MRSLAIFVRTTILGGLLFLAPFVVVVLLAGKAVRVLRRALAPIVAQLPLGSVSAPVRSTTAAILAITAICFLAGLAARTLAARRSVGWLERTVLSAVPGYEYFKQAGASILHVDEIVDHPVVLATVGGAWRIAVQTDVLPSGHVAVFIPNSPNSFSGSLFLVEASKVQPTDISLAAALNVLRRCGTGAHELLDAPLKAAAAAAHAERFPAMGNSSSRGTGPA